MSDQESSKGWLRDFVEFALDRDVNSEIEEQRSILSAYPRNAKAHFDLGVLYYSQRRVEAAINEFEAAIDCEPGYARAYRKLGEIYVNLGDFKMAALLGSKAAELGDSTLLDMFNRYPAVLGCTEKS